MITAIVPARGGSKRIKDKNIKLLSGRPLVFYTLDSLLNHKEVSRIIFTSDSDNYIDIVHKEYGSDVDIIKRPATHATDNTKIYDELLRLSESGLINDSWFMLCLPTAPLRSHEVINKILKLWKQNKTPMFSACEYSFPVQFAFDIDIEGLWKPCFKNSPMITGQTRSQDIPKRYRPNGAIYIQKICNLKAKKTLYSDAKPFVMNQIDSIDIDSQLDFDFAELILNKSKNR